MVVDTSAIRHFLLIVEHGTFTSAATAAHLSQPALSASIAKLEDSLGARLFDRDRNGARLRAEGEALLPHARAAMAALADGRRAVESRLGLESGELALAAGATACTVLLPKVLASFRRRHPNIRVRLLESTTTEALDALDEGSVDLAIVGAAKGAKGLRRFERLYEETMRVVAAPDFEARWRKEHGAAIRPRDLAARVPFLSFRPGSSTRALLNGTFPQANIVMELGSIAAIVSHVRAGVGVALLSEWAVGGELRRRRLVELETRRRFRRELRLCHRGKSRLSPAAAALRTRLLAEAERAG